MWIDWLENRDVYDTAVNYAQKAEIAGKEILLRMGGILVDADFECFRPIDPLLENVECFTAEESPGQLSAGIVGCTPGHPAIRQIVDAIPGSIAWQRANRLPQNHGAGPHILQRNWRNRSDVTVFPPWMFYPYLWDQKKPSDFGDAYGAHHWKATWK